MTFDASILTVSKHSKELNIAVRMSMYVGSICHGADSTDPILSSSSWKCLLKDLSWGFVPQGLLEISIHTLEIAAEDGMGGGLFRPSMIVRDNVVFLRPDAQLPQNLT